MRLLVTRGSSRQPPWSHRRIMNGRPSRSTGGRMTPPSRERSARPPNQPRTRSSVPPSETQRQLTSRRHRL